jgi:hypothetical protein
VIEENLMEKNLDEIKMNSNQYHSLLQMQQLRKNKQIDQVMVEIVEKMHDEENLRQGQIMSMLMVKPNQTINNKKKHFYDMKILSDCCNNMSRVFIFLHRDKITI